MAQSTPVSKWYITHQEFWQHCDEMMKQIVAAVQQGHRYKAIVFAPRGGLPVVYEVISALGSDLLQVAAQINSYHDGKKVKAPRFLPKNLELLKMALADFEPHEILFVDDIRDSGATQRVFLSQFPGAHTACVYARYEGHGLTYVGHVVGNDDWLVFPAEERTVDEHGVVYPRPWKTKEK